MGYVRDVNVRPEQDDINTRRTFNTIPIYTEGISSWAAVAIAGFVVILTIFMLKR